MSFGQFERSPQKQPMAEINMVPLIDVMLVLLVIFIIAAPLLTHIVKIDLPRASATPNEQRVEKIEFSIKANGDLFWNGEAIDRETAAKRFAEEGGKPNPPELNLRADENVPYKFVAETMADAHNGGITRIGFISTPEK